MPWTSPSASRRNRPWPGKRHSTARLFELSPDGILLEDTNGNILDANQALCRSFGYSREELLRQNVRCLVPPEGQGEVEAHLAALRAGQALEHEVWNIRKNGERCLMRLNERPLALPDGRQGILVVARDITESKRAELTKEAFLSLGAKLSAAEARWRRPEQFMPAPTSSGNGMPPSCDLYSQSGIGWSRCCFATSWTGSVVKLPRLFRRVLPRPDCVGLWRKERS